MKKVVGANTTVYIFSGSKPIAEYTNGSLSVKYVYAGSQLLATLYPSTVTPVVYHYPDHLSARLETNPQGNVTRTFGHLPFGETWYETGISAKQKFTSYERDSETGLDYAMFRYDSSRLGRFMTADLLAGAIAAPQTLNRYAYVVNDPQNFADPLGLRPTVWIACLLDQNANCVGGGSGATCTIDGMWAPCDMAYAMVWSGAAYPAVALGGDCFAGHDGSVFCGKDEIPFVPSMWAPPANGFDVIHLPAKPSATLRRPPKSEPKPLSSWEKTGLVIACIAGLDPEFAKPMDKNSQPADSTDSTSTTEGQGPPFGLNKRGRSVPYGGSPEVPNTAAGGAAYAASVGQCITNVFEAWPK